MKRGIPKRLVAAMRERQLIRLTRGFEPGPIRGYVLAVGSKFLVIALVSDRLWLDGYECFRIDDIEGLETDPYATFAEAALAARGEIRSDVSPVSVVSLVELLRTAAAGFPLITVHTEQTDPECCWIGRITSVNLRRVLIQEIRPNATWVAQPREFLLRDITRVNFGGDYEEALFIVGSAGLPVTGAAL